MARMRGQVATAELQHRAAARLQMEEDRQTATRAEEQSEEGPRLTMTARTETVNVEMKEMANGLDAA
eukprot:1050548-Pyramimonas_sp.AAC.1